MTPVEFSLLSLLVTIQGTVIVMIWRVSSWHTLTTRRIGDLEEHDGSHTDTLVDHDRRIQSIEDVPQIKAALNGGYHGRH